MTCYAVIDTNVLVSSLLSKKDDSATVQVLGKVIIGEVIPVYSNVITKEYRKVLSPGYEGSPFLRGSSRKTGCQRISCHRKYQAFSQGALYRNSSGTAGYTEQS